MQKQANTVRITAGIWRNRLLRFPAAPGLRPTPDRVRQTLFNWLGQNLDGKSCLDLFAGSGALGFEARSRGAARVVMVESDRNVAAALRKNAQLLQATNLEIVQDDALRFLLQCNERFDIVFLDPPYASDLATRALQLLPPRMNPGAVVCLERGVEAELGAGWRVLKRTRAGQVQALLVKREGDEQS